jgi:hypothetical protein
MRGSTVEYAIPILGCVAVLFLVLLPMLPMQAVRLQLGVLLAADPTTLAPAGTGNKVAVIIAPFTPVETLVAADLTLATTNGLAAVVCATGTQAAGLDPVTGAQIITLIPGAAPGFYWLTSGTFPPSITVYGYALLDNAETTLLAVAPLNTPVVLTQTGQVLDANPLIFQFVLQPVS